MKLNCDLGELTGSNNLDEWIMPHIDQANIACGFHASTPELMQKTVQLAIKHKVMIGAHPSYPDKENFGRQSMQLTKDEFIANLHYQVGALRGICQAHKTKIDYVKPHGALYNDMMANQQTFHWICQAIAELDPSLILMIQALPEIKPFSEFAQQYGISLWFEAFADRNYQDNGLLVPRSQANAVMSDLTQVKAHVNRLINKKELQTIKQKTLPLSADTLCVHGDNNAALELIKSLRQYLDAQ